MHVFSILLIGCSGGEKDILKRENSSLRLALEKKEKMLNQMETNLNETINSNLILTERINELENTNIPSPDFDKNTNFYSGEKIVIWNIAIDKIITYLDMIRKKSYSSYPALDSALNNLESTENYEYYSSLEIVDELRIQKFPRCDVLQKQIKLFMTNYSAYLASVRNLQNVEPFYALPGTGPMAAAAGRKAAYFNKKTYQKINQAINTYQSNLNSILMNIKRLKIRGR